jgi:REP element-mobilizing transposase RayT
MPNTYSQIYIQLVFAVKNRQSLIHPGWEEELFKYITGIVQRKEQIMIAINGVTNHIHILIAMKPTCCLSDLVREIKKASNEFINENRFTHKVFAWQEGFGAFSYGRWDLENVVRYISNQKEHHKTKSFKTEYLDDLKKFEVEYKTEYLFDWIDENHAS